MSRTGGLVLAVVGLASAWVGVLIGFAFGLPALGFNPYGRNSVMDTVVAEGFAAVLYLFGAVLQIRGGRALVQPQRPAGKVLLLVLVPMAWALVLLVVVAAKNGTWEAIPLALISWVIVVGPGAAGLLSVWIGFRSPRSLR